MVLTFRDEKGSPLSEAEGDANIRTLKAEIDDIVANPPEAISVSNITENATTFTIWLSDGSSFGPFVKPVATLKWREEWTPITGYFANDLVFVTATSTLYLVTQNHISDASFDDTLENSGENIYVAIIGPLGFSTLDGLEDVNFTFREPRHGDIIRFETTLNDVWVAEPESEVVFISTNTYTLDASSPGRYFIFTHVDGCIITVPTVAGGFGASILYTNSGRVLQCCQRGGNLTFIEGHADVTILKPVGFAPATDRVGAVVELRHVGSAAAETDAGVNVWHLYGLLAEEYDS